MLDQTKSRKPDDDVGERSSVRLQVLVLALECHRPLASAAPYSLAGRTAVRIGRGAERAAHDTGTETRLEVPDEWMSSQHARLELRGDRWIVIDDGSKNGTVVNGARIDRVALRHGDLLEIGNTVFLFLDLDPPAPPPPPAPLATLSPPLARDYDVLARLAPSEVPIVLFGDTGVGKEVVARAVHELSGRTGELVAVNCGAIAGSLLESELFGYRKGAFSGATEDRTGRIRAAHRGSLFLDEIAELPAAGQTALLRVLQESEVVPVGGTRPIPVDIRIIAATHRDLPELVASGAFRRDLYARLAGYELTLPCLRDRREDIGLLIATLLPDLLGDSAASMRFTPEAARALFQYDWPLNIRELVQTLRTAATVAGDREVTLSILPAAIRAAVDGGASEGDGARSHIVALLREHHGNVSEVARRLGTSRSQVHRTMKRLGLDPERFRS